ncbi:hypothetical protein AAEX28_11340 [Lentisphaerota bacterium WC36G]|nr:hypothetical protein LJT99_14175 [Lentisphaerae bacterium WC36]
MKKSLFLAAIAATTLALTGCETMKCPWSSYDNEDFYCKDKTMKPEVINEAYYSVMRDFNYPIYPILRTPNFWFSDFGQGDLANLGMGGIFWMNVKGTYPKKCLLPEGKKFAGTMYGYLGHEIYLLPNQTLPEHRHLAGPEGCGAKMESWLVRYGTVMLYSETKTAGAKLIKDLPADQRPWGFGEPWFKSKYYTIVKSGENGKLECPEGWHGMKAFDQGAIVTEFATYHNHVMFSKPGMTFANSKMPEKKDKK